MNLARFGLYIDPAPAQAGAKATIAAARSIKPALQEVKREAESAGGGFEKLLGSIMSVVKGLAAAYAAFKTFQAGFSLAMGAIDKAAQMEGFRTRWAYLLGSFDAAREKMADLQRFANNTPFDLPGVVQASLHLALLKNTGLETMEGLKAVGDAAARAQQPIEEVGSRIARLINNLKRGGGAGDEVRILGEWQVFSPAAVAILQEAGQDASKFAENLALVKAELDNARGSMLLMSTTWSGLTSTLSDSWGTALTKLGEPLINGLKPAIIELTKFVDGMGAQIGTWAPQIEAFGLKVSATLAILNTDGGLALTLEAAADTFRVWFLRAIKVGTDTLTAALPAIGNTLMEIMMKVAKYFVQAIQDALMGILPGIAKSLTNAGSSAVNTVRTGVASDLAKVGNAVGLIDDADLPATLEGIQGTGAAQAVADKQDIDQYFSYYDKGPQASLFPEGDYDMGSILQDAVTAIPSTDAMKQWEETAKQQEALLTAEQDRQKEQNDGLVAGAKSRADMRAEVLPETESAKVKKSGPSEYDKMKDEAARIIEATRTPDEVYQETLTRLDKLRDAGLLNEEQYQRAVQKSGTDYRQSVESQAAAAQAALEKQMTPLQKLISAWGDLGKNVAKAQADITQALSDNITSGLVAMIDGTKSAKEAFADMAKGIVDSIVKIVVQLAVQYALSAALGMAAPVQAVNLGALTAGVKHDGGEVGSGPTRSVPAAAFHSARRFHSGGMIGSDEVPVIAQRGETVLTREQANDIRARLRPKKSADSGEVTVVNVTDPRQLDLHIMSHPEAVLNVLSQNAPQVQRIARNGRS